MKQVNGLLGTGATKVKVDTQNLSFVFGFQPTQNWNIYAGGVYQTIKGNVSLRGQAYSILMATMLTLKKQVELVG